MSEFWSGFVMGIVALATIEFAIEKLWGVGAMSEIDDLMNTVADIELLKKRIDIRLNNHLCEMQPDYDDSITGFHEAWDIVRAVFAEEAEKSRGEGEP